MRALIDRWNEQLPQVESDGSNEIMLHLGRLQEVGV
jgi:hypothetical protein